MYSCHFTWFPHGTLATLAHDLRPLFPASLQNRGKNDGSSQKTTATVDDDAAIPADSDDNTDVGMKDRQTEHSGDPKVVSWLLIDKNDNPKSNEVFMH